MPSIDGQDLTFVTMAPRLEKLFYQPIPVKPATKIPSTPGWQDPKSAAHYIKAKKCGRDAVGILTARTPALDIDCTDRKLVDAIIADVRVMYGQTPKRIGNPPKALLVFKCIEPFKRIQSPWFVMPGDSWRDNSYRAHRVELLCDGQMFVSHAIHNKTKKPYQWDNDIINVPWDDLPLITEDAAIELIDEIWVECINHGALPVRQKNRQWVTTLSSTEKEEKQLGAAAWWLGLSLEELKEPLGLKRSGAGFACRCPNHMGEHSDSLNIRQANDGKLLVHCYGGCEPWEVIEAVNDLLENTIEGIN